MKRPLMRSAKAVPWPILLALILTVSFYSCSKPDLAGIVREHIEAVNHDDIEKNLTFFTDEGVFEPEPSVKLSGKIQLRNLMEWDVVNNARLSVQDMKIKGDTVIAMVTEQNEGWRLIGINGTDVPFKATYVFTGGRIQHVKLEFSPESSKMFDEKFRPFSEWAEQVYPEEYDRMREAEYSAKGAHAFLSLAKEWMDKAEARSTEQEIIKLENDWADAWARHDVAFFERIETNDYTWISPEGEVWTKARDLEFVNSLKPDKDAPYSQVTAEMKVRVYGDAAVVIGRDMIKEIHEGKEISRQERWTDFWIKRNGRWQCAAGHSSGIARK